MKNRASLPFFITHVYAFIPCTIGCFSYMNEFSTYSHAYMYYNELLRAARTNDMIIRSSFNHYFKDIYISQI